MGMKNAEEPFNRVCFITYIFRPPTHTSRHFYTGVAPPPPPGGLYREESSTVNWAKAHTRVALQCLEMEEIAIRV